ncbi:MAG: 4Fe-4S binding protein [Promethearchaeota archaeon]|nr:MAG: 4Fe-4S binding protein [Candidatus Lokiarchaeota archaeon]
MNSPRNPLSDGAGIVEYIFYFLAQGVFPFLLIGILVLILLLTNRFFCGWICPIGLIQDITAALPTQKRTLKMETHQKLLKIKYVIIIFLVIVTISLGISKAIDETFYLSYKESLGGLGDKPLAYFSLSEFLFVILPQLLVQIWLTAGLQPLFENVFILILFLFYVAILVLSVWYPRVYCRYLCPFGAVSSAVSDYSFVKLSRSPVRCVGRRECGICEDVCPKQIRILDEPYEFFTGEGECNLCMKCKEKCPHSAISVKLG